MYLSFDTFANNDYYIDFFWNFPIWFESTLITAQPPIAPHDGSIEPILEKKKCKRPRYVCITLILAIIIEKKKKMKRKKKMSIYRMQIFIFTNETWIMESI